MSMNKNEFNSVLEEQSFNLVEIMGALNGLLDAEGVTSFEQDAISNLRDQILQADDAIETFYRE